MLFKSLQIGGWRQYADVDLHFHPHLTILTGANGSGKTTILNLLARHFNWNVNLVSTPKRDKSTGTLQYLVGLFLRPPAPGGWTDVGELTYGTGRTTKVQVPDQSSQQYNLNLPDQQSVSGLHIPSHRPMYSYQPVSSIPTHPMTRQHIYQEYFSTTYSRFMGNYHAKSPNQAMKEALISLAVFGPGNEYVAEDPSAKQAFEGFQRILSLILPPKVGFKRLSIQMPEVVLETSSGNFSLDAVSGGISSIIDMAWRLFMYSPEGESFVCTMDEPENHLHPELQQSLLPNLIRAFPNVQFIVATHNPFMVTAVYDSAVHILDYNKDQRVYSKSLDSVDKAGTANEVLRDVLGLPFTIPLWADRKLSEIIQKYGELGISEETVADLEAELIQSGLENLIPGLPSITHEDLTVQ